MTLLLNGHYIKQYRVGTGKDNKTPVGTFEVAEMLNINQWELMEYVGHTTITDKFSENKDVMVRYEFTKSLFNN